MFKTYGRRIGKPLRQQQKLLIEELLPKITFNSEKHLGEDNIHQVCYSKKDIQSFLSKYNKVWLEIGFGTGEHITQQAINEPDIGIIGCEPFMNGVCQTLRKINDAHIDNIRILTQDARFILQDLPDHSLNCVFMLFPDPWPKKRHHKRRLLSDDFIALLSKKLTEGGLFRFASDDLPYVKHALKMFLKKSEFNWQCSSPFNAMSPPDNWVQTKYETKAKDIGKDCFYLDFKKQAHTKK